MGLPMGMRKLLDSGNRITSARYGFFIKRKRAAFFEQPFLDTV
jgi:hypothetical protein